jgi:hypothetical protein
MPPIASIKLLSSNVSLPRSSHSIAVIGDTVYILGGEIKPRETGKSVPSCFQFEGYISPT